MSSLRNPNRRPTHPGAILRDDVLPALSMTQTELARLLGVSRRRYPLNARSAGRIRIGRGPFRPLRTLDFPAAIFDNLRARAISSSPDPHPGPLNESGISQHYARE